MVRRAATLARWGSPLLRTSIVLEMREFANSFFPLDSLDSVSMELQTSKTDLCDLF